MIIKLYHIYEYKIIVLYLKNIPDRKCICSIFHIYLIIR